MYIGNQVNYIGNQVTYIGNQVNYIGNQVNYVGNHEYLLNSRKRTVKYIKIFSCYNRKSSLK